MKRLLFLLCGSGVLLGAAELAGVHNVYLMPMARGLDQYLANRLTNEHLFQVVTDPKLADAVLSDHIGEAFQADLEALYPKPPAEKPAAKEPPKDAAKDSPKAEKKKKAALDEESQGIVLATETVNKLSTPASTFGRSKGMVFLVDSKSHLVLWSTFEPPKGSASNDLDRAANDIVSRLKKELYPKAK